jgi:hypothetical protein
MKYNTICKDEKGNEILNWNVEAKSKRDAETKGYLNCMNIAGEDSSIKIKVSSMIL